MREATAAAVGQSHATMYRGKKSKKKKRRSVLLYHTSVERRSWYSAVDGFLDRFSRMRTELVEVLRVRDVVLLLWLVLRVPSFEVRDARRTRCALRMLTPLGDNDDDDDDSDNDAGDGEMVDADAVADVFGDLRCVLRMPVGAGLARALVPGARLTCACGCSCATSMSASPAASSSFFSAAFRAAMSACSFSCRILILLGASFLRVFLLGAMCVSECGCE